MELDPGFVEQLVGRLKVRDVRVTPGLSHAEVARAEQTYGFRFPADLQQLLQTVLPLSDDFPDWRGDATHDIQKRLAWPFEGICFDVEHKQLWLPEWGTRPESSGAALAIARDQIYQAPKLIPIYGNRYISAEPLEAGNPVFSIQQSDMICYGADLPAYLHAEFGVPDLNPARRQPKDNSVLEPVSPVRHLSPELDGSRPTNQHLLRAR